MPGLLAAVSLFAAPEAAAVACPAAAHLEGSTEVLASIRQSLDRHGIAPGAPDGCPVVQAHIDDRAGGLAVVVQDEFGRSSERLVADPETAAIVIESWARTDLRDSLLAQPMVPEPLDARDDERPPASPAVRSTRAVPPVSREIDLTAGGWSALADDGSIWLGLALGGCVRLGPTCTGLVASTMVDTEAAGDSRRTGTSRFGVDLSLAIDLPLALGPLRASPGIGLGVGFLGSASRIVDPAAIHDDVDVAFGGPRVGAHVTVSVPLATHLFLDAALAAELAPLARTGLVRQGDVILAGEPGGHLGIGLGLRFGVP